MESQKILSVPLPASLLQWYEERPTLLHAAIRDYVFLLEDVAKANGYAAPAGAEKVAEKK